MKYNYTCSVEWTESDTQEYVLHDSIYIRYENGQN